MRRWINLLVIFVASLGVAICPESDEVKGIDL